MIPVMCHTHTHTPPVGYIDILEGISVLKRNQSPGFVLLVKAQKDTCLRYRTSYKLHPSIYYIKEPQTSKRAGEELLTGLECQEKG